MRRRMNKSEAGGGTVAARMIKVVQSLRAIRNLEASFPKTYCDCGSRYMEYGRRRVR
jgi:hypothetical protein